MGQFARIQVVVALVLFVARVSGREWSDCDKTVKLSLGQSFTFDSFPPPPQVATAAETLYRFLPYQWQPIPRPPRECTWSFEAVGNCSLQFTTKYYERGDVDCSAQYLLLGDEHSERRICGFRKPPKRLRSNDRELFVTHFQRNCSSNGSCDMTVEICVGVAGNTSLPLPSSCQTNPRPTTPDCVLHTGQCPHPDNCTLTVRREDNGAPAGQDIDIPCTTTTSSQTCSYAYNICSSPKPSA